MNTDFWKLVATPEGLCLVLLSCLFGALVSHLLERAAKKRDDKEQRAREQAQQEQQDRQELIEEVINAYLGVQLRDRIHGMPDFIRAGAARMVHTADLIEASNQIRDRGMPDPLAWARSQLQDDELLPFLKWQAPRQVNVQDYYVQDSFQKLVQRFREQLNGQHPAAG